MTTCGTVFAISTQKDINIHMKFELTLQQTILFSSVIITVGLITTQYMKQDSIERMQEIERRQECYDLNEARKSYEEPYNYFRNTKICRKNDNNMMIDILDN